MINLTSELNMFIYFLTYLDIISKCYLKIISAENSVNDNVRGNHFIFLNLYSPQIH